jgi:nicotinamidase/pyrazinamidase
MEKLDLSQYQRYALIEVDTQNDFCPGGSLPVNEGDLVVPALNQAWQILKARSEGRVRSYPYASRDDWDYKEPTSVLIATRDWHPAETSHFGNPPDFQTTWPVHCVAGTEGAAFHKNLNLKDAEIMSKGTKKDEDAYSGFQARDEAGTTLEVKIGDPKIIRIAVFVGGLATDYCDKATVLDARARGYDTYVLEDAIRGVAPETTVKAMEEMKAAGAKFITTNQLLEAI